MIIDVDKDVEVDRFPLGADDRVPRVKSNVWVDGNGEVAYSVNGLDFDYRNDEVRALCEEVDVRERI